MNTKKATYIGAVIILGLFIAACIAVTTMEVYTECTETHSVGYCITVLSK